MKRWHRVLAAGVLGSLPLFAATPAHGTADDLKPGEVRVLANVDSSSELDVAVTPDGRKYVADVIFGPLYTLDTSGKLTTVAPELFTSDNPPRAIAAGPDGTLYIRADNGLWRMAPDGTRTLIGGGEGTRDIGPADTDRGTAPALEVSLAGMGGIAVGADGVVYVADRYAGRILTIDAAGTLSTIAGAGELADAAADGAPAIEADLRDPMDVAVDSRGAVYFAEEGSGDRPAMVRRINQDGTLDTLLGRNPTGYSGDGGPVEQARISHRGEQIAVDGADNLYLADLGNRHVRKIDTQGVITTVGAPLRWDHTRYDLTIGPNGELYVAGGEEVSIVSPHAGQVDAAEAMPDPWRDDEPGTRHTITTSGPRDLDEMAAGPTGTTYGVSDGRLSVVDIQGSVSEPSGDAIGDSLAVGSDGSVYGIGEEDTVVRRYPDGTTVVLAGGGETTDPRLRATAMDLGLLTTITMNSSGQLYIASGDGDDIRVFRFADGVLEPVRYPVSFNPLGIHHLAVARDGSMHAAGARDFVYWINPDGTIAGKDRYQGVFDLAVADDGTRFVVSSTGVHQRDPDGTQHRIVEGDVSAIALDVHGNLYVAEPDGQIQVIVRPGDVTAGFPWGWAIAGGAVLFLAGAVFGVPRYRRRVRSLLSRERAAGSGDSTEESAHVP